LAIARRMLCSVMSLFKAVSAGVGGAIVGVVLWFIVSFVVPIGLQILPVTRREDLGLGGIGAVSESIPSGSMLIAMAFSLVAAFFWRYGKS
jgi:hypothetical protein